MSSSRIRSLGRFFREVRGEFSKIVWPSQGEFVGAVIIAIIIVSIFAVYLGVVDFCLHWLMKNVFSSVLQV